MSADRTKANKASRAKRIARGHRFGCSEKYKRSVWLLDKRASVLLASGTWHDYHPEITSAGGPR